MKRIIMVMAAAILIVAVSASSAVTATKPKHPPMPSYALSITHHAGGVWTVGEPSAAGEKPLPQPMKGVE